MASEEERTIIYAPVSGLITPLEATPDPTFAQKMVGDGVAIDPIEETLRAPCDGRVAQLHPARHALTIATAEGLEILIHIGLNTVTLKGQGFTALVKEGDLVRRGDELIQFDADYLARHALSLLIMVVLTNDGAQVKTLASGLAEAGTTPLLGIAPLAKVAAPAVATTAARSQPLAILNHDGLHARPLAVLFNNAKKFVSSIKILQGERSANAKSLVGIMSLSIKQRDTVEILAEGPDATAAIETLAPLIQAGLGENLPAGPSQRQDPRAHPTPKPGPQPAESGDPKTLVGVPASPGLAVGPIFQLRALDIQLVQDGQGPEIERPALEAALEAARAKLTELEKTTRLTADPGKAAIFAAHQELLADPDLLEAAWAAIGQGRSAAYAWRESYAAQAQTLASLDNELLAARAVDIRDIGERVLTRLTGQAKRGVEAAGQAILIAPDLTPSDTARLNKSGALGFGLTGGSATSHASILARAAGIPAVVAAPARILDLPDGTLAILDGDKGLLQIEPAPEVIAQTQAKLAELAKTRAAELAAAAQPATTLDGAKIQVVGNISGLAEAEEIPSLGGEGVGLLRSEFLFLERTSAPSEAEQTEVYSAIAKALGPERVLIVRTLDVRGDKPLAYLPLPEEANPFLGPRGIRLNLLGTEIFSTQVRAILQVAPLTKLGIMFPMVASLEEFQAARDLVLREKEALGLPNPVEIGVMVEVPSAALMADLFAPEVDFFSIGTNDLTQYTLSIDRGHPKLAKMADALHPAVLRLIQRTTQAAQEWGKWVGVCGGVASDVAAIPVLIGLGVAELSVSFKMIPAVKAVIRELSLGKCQKMAETILEMASPAEVRKYLAENTPQLQKF
ncbi:MAG: phosphoenolpyruvate--protein phosphotransferase [Deltaproteobacteria bacterium]|jgi:phosphocarrier protein FPr|nr:phosphoenolpyruvate--protein phosphotransferase [Deltaproteobacteria bacterium]